MPLEDISYDNLQGFLVSLNHTNIFHHVQSVTKTFVNTRHSGSYESMTTQAGMNQWPRKSVCVSLWHPLLTDNAAKFECADMIPAPFAGIYIVTSDYMISDERIWSVGYMYLWILARRSLRPSHVKIALSINAGTIALKVIKCIISITDDVMSTLNSPQRKLRAWMQRL